MGVNISESVVDKNCKVHKTQNLFIAGSSVFLLQDMHIQL